jgi:hypothetical protein
MRFPFAVETPLAPMHRKLNSELQRRKMSMRSERLALDSGAQTTASCKQQPTLLLTPPIMASHGTQELTRLSLLPCDERLLSEASAPLLSELRHLQSREKHA